MGRGGFAPLPQLHRDPKGTGERAEQAKTQIAGAGGPWIASIAYQTTPDPRSKDRPSFSLSTARRKSGRGNGKTLLRIDLNKKGAVSGALLMREQTCSRYAARDPAP
ncbi:hypothetical protein FHW16_004007 [Phyllobacterium myrsinacearum]|uniref:Uncharacterized protein n=1 Tax=Phyllobacterium myrsinacearum TaxID=28101 RepID=A0A839EV32_9HYPH|nr:hypothetical protein [Phyllobacterium myrsinacearum]